MNLTDLLIDSTVGFGLGFTLGVSGKFEEYEETIDFVEYSQSDKMGSLPKGLSKEKINIARNGISRIKLLAPFVIGGVYGSPQLFIDSASTQAYITAVPAAYLGRFAGSAVRNALPKNKAKRRDLRILKDIRENPDSAGKYLSEKQRNALEGAYQELERIIVDGGDVEKGASNPDHPFRKAYDAIISEPAIYSNALLGWSLSKTKDIVEIARAQRSIKLIFDEAPDFGVPCVVMGKPSKPEVTIYRRIGEEFHVQNASWPDITIRQYDDAGFVSATKAKPEIKTEFVGNWDGDCRDLASRVVREKDENAFIIMKDAVGAPSSFSEGVIAMTYLPLFQAYTMLESEKRNGVENE